MRISIPDPCLVLLIGASGCGKSTFARRHFGPYETVSSDYCRGVVSNDETNLDATTDAFGLLHEIVRTRLRRGLLTVVDATNVQPEARKPLLALAYEAHLFASAIVLDVPPQVCIDRNRERPDRQFGDHVVRSHVRGVKQSIGRLRKEGFRSIHVLRYPEDIDSAVVERTPLWTDRRDETGPFDIIGDVHGCFSELQSLLTELGHSVVDGETGPTVEVVGGRKLVFLGDLVDRGPDSPSVLKLVMDAVARGVAITVPGNHDDKLKRKLQGGDVKIAHGLGETLEQLDQEGAAFKESVATFLDGLVSHYVLDGGKLVVAHAGLVEAMQGRSSGRVRDFCLYGDTTGELDEFGLPIRYPWAEEYRGKAHVIYGHTPVLRPEWINRTINIDTGCAFGGMLTALRWPERDLVSVPALAAYAESKRGLQDPRPAAAGSKSGLIDLRHILGRQSIETPVGRVTIREENAVAALEAMSRFAADPRWLVYLPPTMSPAETSELDGYLEHPNEALEYFRRQGLGQAICEEKHMGSRAVLVVLRDPAVAIGRFGFHRESSGAILTRTGRPFFADSATESAILDRLRLAAEASRLWSELESDWLLVDAELMPWSSKAQELIRQQYAPVAAASQKATEALASAYAAWGGDQDAVELANRRHADAAKYADAYRHYCWEVNTVEDYRIAPFHLLASEGREYLEAEHLWHMETLGRWCDGGTPILQRTPYRLVDLHDEGSCQAAIDWWTDLVTQGGEGMVVKPPRFIPQLEEHWFQPAIKCRGPEYLRIIYGPDYLEPENLLALRKRGLSRKRALAAREFALGVEAIRRFVAREPLSRVHECVFGVLALESEPVDPRL